MGVKLSTTAGPRAVPLPLLEALEINYENQRSVVNLQALGRLDVVLASIAVPFVVLV